jgi:putative ATPase
MDLFEYKVKDKLKKEAPLAERIRAASLDEFVGQAELVGEGSVLRGLIARDEVPSMVLWGPPGTGKTTLARIIARMTTSRFVTLSAVASGVAELRATVAEAQEFRKLEGTRTIVFVDEIHRWNKAQQDAFLPYVEDGTVTLIGATTENPSFEVNAALLSRCKVFTLAKLDETDIVALLERALADKERGFPDVDAEVEDGVLGAIAMAADGDARAGLVALELAIRATPAQGGETGRKLVRLRLETVAKTLTRSHLLYDKDGEQHYNIISALHKSMRGNDADAALYWLARMLEAGDDPLYVARRLVRFASEDIGLADPQALVQAVAAFQASHQLGMPECNVILAQCVAYLAKAPKSNKLYTAYQAVQKDIAERPNDPVPLHIRNGVTKLMRQLGYGKDYIYTPDDPDAPQEFLPDRLRGRTYLDD